MEYAANPRHIPGTGLLHFGLEGGTPKAQRHITSQRSESKLSDSYVSRSRSDLPRQLNDSYLSRSTSRSQLDRSVSRSRSDLPSRLSGLSDKSDSSVAALPPVRSPLITPRTPRDAAPSKFKPQFDFKALRGTCERADKLVMISFKYLLIFSCMCDCIHANRLYCCSGSRGRRGHGRRFVF